MTLHLQKSTQSTDSHTQTPTGSKYINKGVWICLRVINRIDWELSRPAEPVNLMMDARREFSLPSASESAAAQPHKANANESRTYIKTKVTLCDWSTPCHLKRDGLRLWKEPVGSWEAVGTGKSACERHPWDFRTKFQVDREKGERNTVQNLVNRSLRLLFKAALSNVRHSGTTHLANQLDTFSLSKTPNTNLLLTIEAENSI